MGEPIIKDSGKQREFGTGAHRDFAEGKGRTDLLPCKYVSKALSMVDEIYSTDVQTLLVSALTTVLNYVGEKDRNDEDIYSAIINITIAEGLHENAKTKDCQNISAKGMFSYGIMQVSRHFEDGAKKYGANNWQNGMPLHVYLDSAMRHMMKAVAGMEDEPHIRAASWNLLCYLWTKDNKPELNDLD